MASGRNPGRPALGYRTRLEINPSEAIDVQRAFEFVASSLSIRETGRLLGMDEKQVRRILHYEPYKQAGELRIIEPKLWTAAHRQLAKRRPR